MVFNAIKTPPTTLNALRWYNHIKSYASEFPNLPGSSEGGKAFVSSSAEEAAAPAGGEDEDEVDLFGSDEEEDEEAEKIKAQRLAEYNEKKAKKAKTIAKSVVTMEVKPWDDETDMVELEKSVRSIEQPGLVWGLSKLVAVGYGIKKLQINLVIGRWRRWWWQAVLTLFSEDELVSLDELQEKIAGFEDYVQSTDIAAMQSTSFSLHTYISLNTLPPEL